MTKHLLKVRNLNCVVIIDIKLLLKKKMIIQSNVKKIKLNESSKQNQLGSFEPLESQVGSGVNLTCFTRVPSVTLAVELDTTNQLVVWSSKSLTK